LDTGGKVDVLLSTGVTVGVTRGVIFDEVTCAPDELLNPVNETEASVTLGGWDGMVETVVSEKDSLKDDIEIPAEEELEKPVPEIDGLVLDVMGVGDAVSMVDEAPSVEFVGLIDVLVLFKNGEIVNALLIELLDICWDTDVSADAEVAVGDVEKLVGA
jgi:hypothetical protein